MPRNVNPKDIKLGPGQTVPDRGAEVGLVNGVVIGGGGGTGGDAGLVLQALKAHINDPKDAHEGSAIGVYPIPPFLSDSVEGTLQEVSGGTPYEPPKFGKMSRYTDFHSIPDWGAAKLNESPIYLRDADFDALTNTNDYGDVFPYFLRPPSPTVDFSTLNYNVGLTANQDYSPGFTPSNPWITPAFDGQVMNKKYDLREYGTAFPAGTNVFADRVFNYDSLLGADNPNSLKSGGPGTCYAGGFTRTDGKVQKSLHLVAHEATDPWPRLVTISGAVYPADRGVLALLHFPHLSAPTSTDPWSDEMKTAFLNQDLLERCVAAILLGQGVLGDACIDASGTASIGAPYPPACDGGPGGIFSVGQDEDGNYDPFAFPGRASGQYNLKELHTGTSSIPGIGTLPHPWDNLTGQGAGAGAKRGHYLAAGDDYYPAAGQVRLGSDVVTGLPILPWGIPVLGGTDEAYDGVLTDLYTDYPAIPYIGHSAIHDTNFFKYRLPTLDDYSDTSGLKYTPQNRFDPTVGESYRYFRASTTTEPSADPYTEATGKTSFETAGNYPPFQQDCTTWQIARYRHTFAMDGGEAAYPGDHTPLGSYAMFHFKTEKDFESLVRDGVMPTDFYGIHFLTDQSNVVNENTAVTSDPVYDGPIPNFSWGANFFNGLKNEVYVNGPVAEHEVDRFDDINTNEFTWTVPALAALPGIMWVSGVAYFTPKKFLGALPSGTDSFEIDSVDVDVDNTWTGCYRTDDITGTGGANTPPAVENSPNPALMNFKCFGADVSSILPATYPASWYRHDYAVEFPFSDLGAFTWNAGPTGADAMTVSLSDNIVLSGDDDEPSFSSNAKPWFYIRRPLTHGGDWEEVIQPTWDVANGHGFALDDAGGDIVQLHTTQFWADGADGTGYGQYGNYTLATPVNRFATNHYPVFASLVTAQKDVEERFLDEVYRYQNSVPVIAIPAAYKPIFYALLGPGLSSWHSGPIPVPVQAGVYHYAADFPPPWDTWGLIGPTQVAESLNNVSWTQLGKHLNTLTTSSLDDELQVMGLPPRNPKLLDWATVPFPSAGMVRYPSIDYTAALYRPKETDNASAVLRDYATPYGEDVKSYVRAFDVAYSRSSAAGSTPPWKAAGQPFVTLRIDGIELEDFQYAAPGPGTVNEAAAPKISIQLKVPGLTTWMDVGRPDGSGPSKQDPALDGAGCKVLGLNTLDGVDSETGMVYCQVRVNVGPMANLAAGIETSAGSGLYEVPVLVRVQMNSMTVGEYDLVGGGAGTAAGDVRGITGIKVVHPTQVETST